VDELGEVGIAEDTIAVWTSDNGADPNYRLPAGDPTLGWPVDRVLGAVARLRHLPEGVRRNAVHPAVVHRGRRDTPASSTSRRTAVPCRASSGGSRSRRRWSHAASPWINSATPNRAAEPVLIEGGSRGRADTDHRLPCSFSARNIDNPALTPLVNGVRQARHNARTLPHLKADVLAAQEGPRPCLSRSGAG
jgi:hypothetical protein